MKKCFWAPGRVIFLCNESGFCQRKEPARSEYRRAVSFQEREPASRAAPSPRDPHSLRAFIYPRLAGAPPRTPTSGQLFCFNLSAQPEFPSTSLRFPFKMYLLIIQQSGEDSILWPCILIIKSRINVTVALQARFACSMGWWPQS